MHFVLVVFLLLNTWSRPYDYPLTALPPDETNNMFCEVDYISEPGEIMDIIKCERAVDCNEMVVWEIDKPLCTNVI